MLWTVRATWLASGAAVIFAAGTALAQGTGDPAANWARAAACARIERGDERQACVDEVFRSTGLLDRARDLAQQRENFGEPRRERPQPAPPAAAATPRPSPAPASASASASAPAPAPAPAPPAELDEIATTVSRAFDPGNRLMVIVTQDGQAWQQNESKDLGLPPRPGTRFTVAKGSLGSFICRIGGGRSFRCRRQG